MSRAGRAFPRRVGSPSGRDRHAHRRHARLGPADTELAVAIVAPAMEAPARGDPADVREADAERPERQASDDGARSRVIRDLVLTQRLELRAPAQRFPLDGDTAGEALSRRAMGADAAKAVSARHRARLERRVRAAIAEIPVFVSPPAVRGARGRDPARVQRARAHHREAQRARDRRGPMVRTRLAGAEELALPRAPAERAP